MTTVKNGYTYVSSELIDELYTRIKALEYRVSQHDADINGLDWAVNGENFEEEEQMELDLK
jgi:hypothetical protein